MKTINDVLQAIINGEKIQKLRDDGEWCSYPTKDILFYIAEGESPSSFSIEEKPLIYERSVSFMEYDKRCPVYMNKLPSGNNVKFIFDKHSKKLIGVELIEE